MEDRPILKNTCLCAIVRDEAMNPAGGIVDFIDSTVPNVTSAVIVDTGSVDGTRELLEEAQSRYPHLRVYDRQFRGFADARNYSIEQTEAEKVLVLDADERLTQDDFRKLRDDLSEEDIVGCFFRIFHINPSGTKVEMQTFGGTHHARLFKRPAFRGYTGEVWERPDFGGQVNNLLFSHLNPATIKHFVPTDSALNAKKTNFYDAFFPNRHLGSNLSDLASIPRFSEWKKYNRVREEYR
jgi:glycosyltransferase involved in cell wall biosynthesis